MSALAAVQIHERDEVVERLAALLRPEFKLAVVRPDPFDPVLAGRPCGVDTCGRPAHSRGLCVAHHARWVGQGKPDISSFTACAAPVRHDHHPRANEVFDFSPLPPRCRLEFAYVLQQRHDARGRGLRPGAVRPVVAMVASSGVTSLLDRSVEQSSSTTMTYPDAPQPCLVSSPRT
jgi:hypothetical protein